MSYVCVEDAAMTLCMIELTVVWLLARFSGCSTVATKTMEKGCDGWMDGWKCSN